ncbi:MAG: hypothetical protein COA78_11200 [Blastopirellula sp.]|nr:MAG: hypothetical protein COA78_11200 [Blastopirellula sp.]
MLDHRLEAYVDQKLLKVEGITDLLAAISVRGEMPGWLPITTANGAGAEWKPWMLQSVQDREMALLHDCDKPGQDGADKLVKAAAPIASSIKNYQLPYQIKDNHGEDLRDWFEAGGTGAKLIEAIDQEAAIDVSEIDFRSDTDPDRIAERIIKDYFTVDGVRTLILGGGDWCQWDTH